MIDFHRVTTRRGDNGTSTIFGGKRWRKDHAVFDVLGTVDELTAWLGVVRSAILELAAGEEARQIEAIQKDLFRLGSEVAAAQGSKALGSQNVLGNGDVERIEMWEKALMKMVELPSDFVIPGATLTSSYIDVARTVTRRLERVYVSVKRKNSLVYLNRLSDYLYILARHFDNGQI